MNVDLLNIINNIIFKKQISWQFGIENARIVTKYAVGCDSVSEMIFSGDYNFTGVLVPTFDFDFSETTFLEKLKIKHWSYSDFVLSAILFCIQYELTRGTFSFFILSKNIVYLLFNETLLGEEVFNVLKSTNLFTSYQEDTLAGINSFFYDMIIRMNSPRGYSWNRLGISRVLSLFDFHFTDSFIDKCITDCINQNTLGPFILALYVLRAQMNLLTVTQSESLAIVDNFKNFKKFLKEKKYLSDSFFFNQFLEKKDIKKFYGSNIQYDIKQAGTVSLIAVCVTMAVATIFTNQSKPKIPAQNAIILQRNKVQTNPSFVPEPTKYYNRPRITVYSQSASNNNSLEPMGSILGATDDINKDNIEITEHKVYVKIRKFSYVYLIVKVDGIYKFCPYGIHGPYANLKYDMTTHIIPDAKRVFKKLGVPFVYLGDYTDKEYNLDHVLKECFRDAFNLPHDKSQAVVVPPFLNAERTNKQVNDFEYSLSDFRLKGPWVVNDMPALNAMLYERMLDSIAWTRNKILSAVDPSNSQLQSVLDQIELGYNAGLSKELTTIQNTFLKNFASEKSWIKNANGCFAFLHEMLLQGRQSDLQDMKHYKLEYLNPTTSTISKNFFIRQVVTATDIQIRTAQALSELMSDSSVQRNYKTKHEQLTQELKYELEQFVNSYSTNSDFDIQEANGFLKQLSETKIRSPQVDELVSIQNNRYINLENMCNKTLQLGNSYKSSGKVLDTTIGAANDFAKISKKKRAELFEKFTEKSEVKLFPLLSELSDKEYAALAKQANGYAQYVLKKTASNAVSAEKYQTELTNSESIVNQLDLEQVLSTINNLMKNSDRAEFPTVPPRKTSDEERFNKLLGFQSQNAPASEQKERVAIRLDNQGRDYPTPASEN